MSISMPFSSWCFEMKNQNTKKKNFSSLAKIKAEKERKEWTVYEKLLCVAGMCTMMLMAMLFVREKQNISKLLCWEVFMRFLSFSFARLLFALSCACYADKIFVWNKNRNEKKAQQKLYSNDKLFSLLFFEYFACLSACLIKKFHVYKIFLFVLFYVYDKLLRAHSR